MGNMIKRFSWSDPRVRWGTAGLAAVALGVAVLAFGRGPVANTLGEPTGEPAASTTPDAAATAAVAAETTSPIQPSPTPEGTPAPRPDVALGTGASAEVPTPTPAPEATPTATPQPGLWRVQGYVLDEDGKPLSNVCVVVGPNPCAKYSPHTDKQGHYFLDVAEPHDGGPLTTFDFYFEMPGRQTVWWHFTPTGPIDFNVVLHRS